MLSNDFWYGFVFGAFLVFAIVIVTQLIIRTRAKNTANSKLPK